MSFLQKLCDVYDAVIDTTGAEGENALLPIGFVQKKIKYNVLLSHSGEFVTAQLLPDDAQSFAVPSTPQAEGRTGTNGAPFPLADGLKYLIAGKKNPLFDSYIAQLENWCRAPHAPECLRVLLNYLKRKTLYADLYSVFGRKLKYYRDESDTTGEGADAKSMACFSIACVGEEQRLWMRADVRQSWLKQLASMPGEETGLCYITGLRLPIMENHPKLQGNAKLISARDVGFPFQYKGRFVDDRSAATVSILASSKAHNALKWLLDHQGFHRYGMSIVGWNTKFPELDLEEDDEKPLPDTFEPYVNALLKSLSGCVRNLEAFSKSDELTDEARQRIENIVLVGMQAATDGRMSVTYEQEMPGNVFTEHVRRWHEACRWQMPSPSGTDSERPATWLEICEAVMGVDAVRIAKGDFKADKAATKRMRELQLRLLHCAIEGQALPGSMVSAAFHRAVQPLSFTTAKGKWDKDAWLACVSTTCAMIRKHAIDSEDAFIPTPALDASCADRDYLYGRLFAIAHMLEQNASEDSRTNAVRLMTRFVQRPTAAWLELYGKLLPYLRTLGKEGRACFYKRRLALAEGRFRPSDVSEGRPLSFQFLIGFSAQLRALNLEKEDAQAAFPAYAPPKTRDELFGCLLAVADFFEWRSERQKTDDGKTVSSRDGRTNAMQLTAEFIARPMTTWPKIHDRLIPYLEKSGVKTAARAQRLFCKIEQSFLRTERLSDVPLGRGFLHGYLRMLEALSAEASLNGNAWEPAAMTDEVPATRDAAFGMLLALENQMERYTLDLEKTEDENRPSNAMRFMTRIAQRPNEVWSYLEARMRPYQRKSGFSHEIRRRADALHALILERQWDSDVPLGPAYLYYFYLHNQPTDRKDA